MKPDILADLTTQHSQSSASEAKQQRLLRERADLDFIVRQAQVFAATEPQAQAYRAIGYDKVTQVDMEKPPQYAVCVRLDAEHPLLASDNLVAVCVDCGCSIQHRPEIPVIDKLCICCAARRVREAE